MKAGLAFVGVIVTALLSLSSSGAQDKNLLIGVEYAFPGLGKTFAELRIPAVKLYPGLFAWGKMQKAPEAAIDFTMLDRLVRDYHDAGFQEIYISLSTINKWANKGPKNYTPKAEYGPHFDKWIQAIVERYDGDGTDDMPGLKRPLRYYEISEEFSSYTPEPTADYLAMLERAYKAAHAAFPGVTVLHAAFLTTTVFKDHPGPARYAAAFAAAPKRFMDKTLADIRALLSRPDIFDAVNFHSLGDPLEIEDNVAWLRHEMAQRKYERPIFISDTSPNFLIGWGPATRASGPPATLGILVPPATEKDRPRLAQYFQKLVDGDKATIDWNHGFVADDMVKRVVVAAEQKVVLINTAFMEDLVLLQAKFLQAGAGTSAWAGFVGSKINIFNERRTVTGKRAPFYAVGQLQGHLRDYADLRRLPHADKHVRIYRWQQGQRTIWLAWLDPGKLLLPGDDPGAKMVHLKTGPGDFIVERAIDRPGQTAPDQATLTAEAGIVSLKLTARPVYLFARK